MHQLILTQKTAMIGEKLGPFLIEEKLGSGAMGVVYRASHEPSGQSVAIKVVAQEAAARTTTAERFERESDILKQFRHPNIVQHIGVGFSKTRGLRYYAMEYVPGTTLEKVLEKRGPLPWEEVVELGIQMCAALHYAHERGVVHRDLKPSNLLITQRGELKLADFGIAKDLDRTALTADGRTLGTAAYMAPEQIRGVPPVSHKTDLYALGCLLFQLITGRIPFEGRNALELMHKHLDEPPPRPSSLNPDIPTALDKLIVTLMSKDRDQRPWDAQAVSQSLITLKEKKASGEKIPMAFSKVPANPSRLGSAEPVPAAAVPETAATSPTRKTIRKKTREARSAATSAASLGESRVQWETIALVAGLIGLISLVAYMLWPPSMSYLHRQSAKLMASTERADRNRARDKYMADLDRRFPDHPYKDQLREWRDQFLKEDGLRRADFLMSPGLSAAIKPRNEFEEKYSGNARIAAENLKEGLDLDALAVWQQLAAFYETIMLKDPPLSKPYEDARMWFLVAQEKGIELKDAIEQRKLDLTREMNRILELGTQGRAAQSEELAREVGEEYGKYQSIREQLSKITLPAPPTDTPETPLEEPPPDTPTRSTDPDPNPDESTTDSMPAPPQEPQRASPPP